MGDDIHTLLEVDMRFSVSWSKKYAGQRASYLVHMWDKREPTLVS